MVTLRRSTKTTWMGLSVAERFADGSDPFIGDIIVTDKVEESICVSADKNSFVAFNGDDEIILDFSAFYQLNDKMTSGELNAVLALGTRY